MAVKNKPRSAEPGPPDARRLKDGPPIAEENGRETEEMFEGFVRAAVAAIERRDPPTTGHALRVAGYAQALAEAVDAAQTGPYAGVRFGPAELRAIRYAALLHDFGKIAVREEMLVKTKKLYPQQLELIRQRFDYIRKELEAAMVRRKLQMYLERTRGDALSEIARISEDFEQRMKKIQEDLELIAEANEPAPLSQSQVRRLNELGKRSYLDPKGIERPCLKPDEIRLLSIAEGNLDASERRQAESHVMQTYSILSQVPWTKALCGVPDTAKAHHERLNGSGYPGKLRAEEIPLPARILALCDIFDTLTAVDRPHKRAVPSERALVNLEESVRAGELDAELFRLFREARVYERKVHPA